MPAGDTVWPVEVPRLVSELAEAGLEVRWQEDTSRSHQRAAAALADAYEAAAGETRDQPSAGVLAGLVASHRLWSDWLGSGRLRKLAFVAAKVRTT
jgi:hypothetical protein